MIISRGIPFSGLVVPATTRYRSVMELSRLGLPVKFNFSPVFYRTGKIYLDTVFLIVAVLTIHLNAYLKHEVKR